MIKKNNIQEDNWGGYDMKVNDRRYKGRIKDICEECDMILENVI